MSSEQSFLRLAKFWKTHLRGTQSETKSKDPEADAHWHKPTHGGKIDSDQEYRWIAYAEPWCPALNALLLNNDTEQSLSTMLTSLDKDTAFRVRNRFTFGANTEKAEDEGGYKHPKTRRFGDRLGKD